MRKSGMPVMSAAHRRIIVTEIQRFVAEAYKIDPCWMTGRSRRRRYAHPRQAAMFLAYEITTISLPQIGQLFGNRHHTTVMYAIRAVNERLLYGDRRLRETIEAGRILALLHEGWIVRRNFAGGADAHP